MREKQILAIVKEPGQEPRTEPLFENTLEAFQAAVGGYIEAVTFCDDGTIICNEEGALQGLPYNCRVLGLDFYGTILIVGVKGDEFASLPGRYIPMLMQMLYRESKA